MTKTDDGPLLTVGLWDNIYNGAHLKWHPTLLISILLPRPDLLFTHRQGPTQMVIRIDDKANDFMIR